MGAHLVKLAVTNWAAKVTDSAFRVLITMAITALDKPKGPIPSATYFGGHERLAATMRRERDGTQQAAVRRVTRAIAELIVLGAIKLILRAQPGRHATYLLQLDRAPEPPESIDE